ncbi:hypothetical protein ABIF96_005819 [Bradyrhizobium ottawaense]|uniref:hypothetical protein n=1 Tax=Bradyrhizobium ottawaense TaxID=931866 RepID=UPI0038392364
MTNDDIDLVQALSKRGEGRAADLIEKMAQESDAEFARLTGIILDKEKEVRDLRIDNARLRDEKSVAEINARKDIELKKQFYDEAHQLRAALAEIASLYSGGHGYRATEIAKDALRVPVAGQSTGT